MAKKLTSYRLDETVLKKLEILYEYEKKQSEKYNVKAKSMTEIIEDAVSEYYVMKLDKDTGTDYLTRMNVLIQDAIKQQNKQFDYILNEIAKKTMLSYEGVITLLKCQGMDRDKLPTNPVSAKYLVEKESIYDEPISDKVEEKIQRGE